MKFNFRILGPNTSREIFRPFHFLPQYCSFFLTMTDWQTNEHVCCPEHTLWSSERIGRQMTIQSQNNYVPHLIIVPTLWFRIDWLLPQSGSRCAQHQPGSNFGAPDVAVPTSAHKTSPQMSWSEKHPKTLSLGGWNIRQRLQFPPKTYSNNNCKINIQW